jgi:hypothetical protein
MYPPICWPDPCTPSAVIAVPTSMTTTPPRAMLYAARMASHLSTPKRSGCSYPFLTPPASAVDLANSGVRPQMCSHHETSSASASGPRTEATLTRRGRVVRSRSILAVTWGRGILLVVDLPYCAVVSRHLIRVFPKSMSRITLSPLGIPHPMR